MTSQADSPPSWPQPPIPTQLLHRRRTASALLTMPVIIVLISIPTVALSFFAIPHVLSNQLWKSTVGIRRGWDALNIVLVLFAVLCGIFAPRRGDEAAAEEAGRASAYRRSSSPKAEKAFEITAEQWFQSIDSRIYELPKERMPVAGISRLRRNYGSYTNLTQESWPPMGERHLQLFDDSAVEGYYQRLDQPARVPLRRWQCAIDESEIKEIPVDTFFRGSLSPPSVASPGQAKPRPPPTPPPPPPPNSTQKKRSGYDFEAVGETITHPPPPPPPLPLPPQREQSPVRIKRRKSSATAELKEIIASVLSSNKRKKRRPKDKTIEESASVRHSTDETHYRRIEPPPPPPQPQSFLSIFKKTSKSRRIHSASAQPLHPPPHPSEHGRQSTALRSTKPPLPTIPKKNRVDRSTGHPSGIPVAPPTTPPNRLRRSRESGIAETDGDDLWSPPTVGKKRATSSSEGDGAKGSGHVDGEDVVKGGPGPVFCESPDVNAKADTFIARLKDRWRLERMNSIREKHGLGIGPGPL